MLQNIKLLLGISPADTDRDELLKLLISMVSKRLKSRLGGTEPPEELDHIITELVVIRFNRIGSEGLSSHSEEGVSLAFSDDDFAPYEDDIQAYLDTQKESSIGKVRFI